MFPLRNAVLGIGRCLATAFGLRHFTRILVLSGLALGVSSAYGQLLIVQPAGVGFSNLGGTNGQPYLGHVEGGFSVTPTAGSWFISQIYGTPLPSIYDGPVNTPGVGVLQITGGAVPFTLSSFDFSSNNGDSLYNIRGFLGPNLQYEETGTLAGTFGPFAFSTLSILNSTVPVDGLFIGLTPDSGVTSINIDRIQVMTVPEPACGLLLTFAALAAFYSHGRRRLR